jgi:hypothetical protein
MKRDRFNLDPIPEDCLEAAKELGAEWFKEVPSGDGGKRKLDNHRGRTAVAMQGIREAYGLGADLEVLKLAARMYLASIEDKKYTMGLAFFFGPGKPGRDPIWPQWVRVAKTKMRLDSVIEEAKLGTT